MTESSLPPWKPRTGLLFRENPSLLSQLYLKLIGKPSGVSLAIHDLPNSSPWDGGNTALPDNIDTDYGKNNRPPLRFGDVYLESISRNKLYQDFLAPRISLSKHPGNEALKASPQAAPVHREK
jgi:hypothetical protein